MTPESQKQTTDWLIAIGAVALPIITVILSILTVFQDKIRAWILKPKISVSVGGLMKTPIKTKESLTDESRPKLFVTVFAFSLLVKNSGNLRAEEVEVFASSLFEKQADDTYKEIKSFPNRNLSWMAEQEPFVRAISPGMQRHINVCAVLKPTDRAKAPMWDRPDLGVPADRTILSFEFCSKPFSGMHLFGPGTYHLVLHVAAANIKPQKVTVEISHKGLWFDEEDKMLGQGLGIRIV
jgi:hypothetical protein